VIRETKVSRVTEASRELSGQKVQLVLQVLKVLSD
jgi:hypothetical protein